MTLSHIIPIIFFTVSMSITPGPNNIMLTASGANFGFRRTIPHLLGIWSGFVVIMIISAVGLKEVFEYVPAARTVLKIIGFSYMLFLAWKILNSGSDRDGDRAARPITFLQGALFQIINPKVIMMSLTIMSAYTLSGDRFLISAVIAVVLFVITGFPCTSLWALFGTVIGKQLRTERKRKQFNTVLAILTTAAAVMMIL